MWMVDGGGLIPWKEKDDARHGADGVCMMSSVLLDIRQALRLPV